MKRLLLLFVLMLAACQSNTFEEEVSPASFSQYHCESRDLVMECNELSSTMITCYQINELGVKKGYRCYEGWKPYGNLPELEAPYRCGDYHCYPKLGYCLLGGDINNPPIPRKEVCDINA